MAAAGDSVFLEDLMKREILRGSVLELGSYNRQGGDLGNARAIVERRGLRWQGTDIEDGPGVDFTMDILDRDAVQRVTDRWDGVLVMNLLEHVYDPIRALENALALLSPGGVLVVVGPAIWELHDFPIDCWRPLPGFFIEFAKRHNCEIPKEGFAWITLDRIIDVEQLKQADQLVLPSTQSARSLWPASKVLRSRALHRLARTYGRDMFFPFVGLGVCLRTASNGNPAGV